VAGREAIPRLDELLGAWPDLRVNIDTKADRSVAPLAEVVRRTGSLDRVCVGSFSAARVAEVRRLLPGVCTSTGPLAVGRLVLAGFGLPVGRFSAACAQVPVRKGRLPVTTKRLVAAAHRRGLQVHVWTLDDPVEMNRMLDLGVDGLMTDLPGVLKDVLVQRGEWAGG
jgi:glycerophosphoryl diester phosphodiesterase